eukprot:gene31669-35754_t
MLGEAGKLHKDALTVSGESIWDEVKDVRNWNDDVILPVEKALTQQGGIVVLRGNLAPKGCVLKPSAASPHLMKHRGRAVVFEDIDDYKAKINDEALDIDETCVMVLKYCGPRGYPGMAEVGNMGLPPKVLRKGITDMVRISDARMSGTAYGTVLLHTSPEAARGGPLAIVKNGDFIEVDVEARRVHLDISDEEMQHRLAEWRPPVEPPASGYAKLFHDHVEGADTGLPRFAGRQGCTLRSRIMADRIPLALVGIGKIARDQHIPSIAGGNDFVVAAGVSRHGKVEGAENFTDFNAFLAARPDIKVVSLCTPPEVRFDMAKAAIAAGRHVLMEKPPATTLGEAEALSELAAKAGVTLFATWHSRFALGVEPARH